MKVDTVNIKCGHLADKIETSYIPTRDFLIRTSIAAIYCYSIYRRPVTNLIMEDSYYNDLYLKAMASRSIEDCLTLLKIDERPLELLDFSWYIEDFLGCKLSMSSPTYVSFAIDHRHYLSITLKSFNYTTKYAS